MTPSDARPPHPTIRIEQQFSFVAPGWLWLAATRTWYSCHNDHTAHSGLQLLLWGYVYYNSSPATEQPPAPDTTSPDEARESVVRHLRKELAVSQAQVKNLLVARAGDESTIKKLIIQGDERMDALANAQTALRECRVNNVEIARQRDDLADSCVAMERERTDLKTSLRISQAQLTAECNLNAKLVSSINAEREQRTSLSHVFDESEKTIKLLKAARDTDDKAFKEAVDQKTAYRTECDRLRRLCVDKETRLGDQLGQITQLNLQIHDLKNSAQQAAFPELVKRHREEVDALNSRIKTFIHDRDVALNKLAAIQAVLRGPSDSDDRLYSTRK